MKAIIFSDLHIHDYKQFNKDHSRLENCVLALWDIARTASDAGIDVIIFGGDMYDTQQSLKTMVVNRTVEFFIAIFKEFPEIRWYAITGNHDQSEKSLYTGPGGKPAESALKHIAEISGGNFTIIDNMVVPLGSNCWIAGIPYYEYAEHFTKALSDMSELVYQDVDEPEPTIHLIIHQTPRGIGNEMIAYETDPDDKLYDRFNAVWDGHIHARQKITEKFTVIGSPIHRDLGDEGQQKGFLVVDLLNPTSDAKFVYLSGYPEFKQVYKSDHDPDSDGADYVVVKPDSKMTGAEIAGVQNFSVDLSQQTLVENYWKEAEGSNKKLLEVGLSCI